MASYGVMMCLPEYSLSLPGHFWNLFEFLKRCIQATDNSGNTLRCFLYTADSALAENKSVCHFTIFFLVAKTQTNGEETTFLGHRNTSAEFLKVNEKSLNFTRNHWEHCVYPCHANSSSQQ